MANVHGMNAGTSGETFLAFTQRAVFGTLGTDTNPLDAWIRQAELCRTTKEKGDLFEDLCVAYLLHPQGGKMISAWRLPNLPEAVRKPLGLPTRDYGIDIIALDTDGRFHAVQAKFKGRSNFRPNRYRKSLRVTWTELSTFYALARRGPYVKHWVITTADGVTRAGGRCPEDRGVCYRGLKAMPAEFWREVAQMRGHRLDADATPGAAVAPAAQVPAGRQPTPEEVRAIRLARFGGGAAQQQKDDGDTLGVDYASLWAEFGVEL